MKQEGLSSSVACDYLLLPLQVWLQNPLHEAGEPAWPNCAVVESREGVVVEGLIIKEN